MTLTAVREPASPAGASTGHSHVLAVQDWGGSQEYWRGWDDNLTLADAEQLARDAVRADSLWWQHQGEQPDATDRLDRELGDRWPDLISTNLCPGWSAIWIVDCREPCEWSAENDPGDLRPWWTAGRHLQLVHASSDGQIHD
jgi:hypothetical protein